MYKKHKKYLIFIFIFSFVARAIFFLGFVKNNPVIWEFDSRVYRDVASQILNSKTISNLDRTPHFYRVPGYSLFLTLTSFKEEFYSSLWIQIFLSCFIPILIFYLSLTIFPNQKRLAIITSLFSVFHLGFILFSGLVMTETLFLILFLFFLIYFFKDKVLIAGLFLGLASMFRPVGHYLVFISIVLILFLTKGLRSKIQEIGFVFLGWFIVVLPWLMRNFLLTGVLFFTTLPGIHFLKHSAARIYMEINKVPYSTALNSVSFEWKDYVLKQERIIGRKLNAPEVCNLGEKLSFSYLKKDFYITFKHCFVNVFKTAFSLYSSELLFLDSGGKLPSYDLNNNIFNKMKKFLIPKVNNKYLIPIIYFEILTFFFLILGFVGFIFKWLFIKKEYLILFKLFPFIGLFLFISLSCGFARLRLPIEPILILLSLRFWSDVFQKKRVSYE